MKSGQVTESERILATLCEKTFLSLWSFPNVYTDDGIAKGQGKELCDLLVVFNEHVLIFSDKGEVKFSSENDLAISWPRWVKKAFLKSSYQVYQAEKWVKQFSSRIFLDRKCSQPFPVEIPDAATVKIHRIVVTRGIAEHAKKYFGGKSGSLLLCPFFEGEEIFKFPFQIGIPDKDKGFVHFFDDEGIDILFKEFDTISDFIDYLSKKEVFLTTQKAIAQGEQELIGLYLSSRDESHLTYELNFPDFNSIYAGVTPIITEGIYDDYTQKNVYRALKEFVEPSFLWDSIIERIGQHAFTGNWGYTSADSYDEEILPLKFMAAESRIGRTILSNNFLEWAWPAFKEDASQPRVRVLSSPSNSDVCYVLLILPHSSTYLDYNAYREDRKSFLMAYCFACKDLFPEYSITVGLAFDPRSPTRFDGNSEDMAYLDSSDWTYEQYKDAKKIRTEMNFFQKVKLSAINHAYSDKKEKITIFEMSEILRYKLKKEKAKKKAAKKQRKRNRKPQ